MKRLLLLLALSSALCGCRSLQLVEQDERVKIYERLPLLPHGYDYEVLEFKGKRYPYLYSYSYVYVAELDGIIFATQRGEGHVKLHFVPVHEGREITVSEGEYYSFGVDLGVRETTLTRTMLNLYQTRKLHSTHLLVPL